MSNQPCPRCGKQNPADIHTCTPLALKLAEELMAGDVLQAAAPAAAELRRLHNENELLHKRCQQAYEVGRQSMKEDCQVLLRQALRLLDFYGACYGVAKSDMPTITALRERLGENT